MFDHVCKRLEMEKYFSQVKESLKSTVFLLSTKMEGVALYCYYQKKRINSRDNTTESKDE